MFPAREENDARTPPLRDLDFLETLEAAYPDLLTAGRCVTD